MRRFGQWMATVAAVLAAGCGGDGADGGISPTGPSLLVGPTVTVTVSCPTQMETGTSGSCTAYGYDGNGSFTNSSVSSWSSSNTSVATISSGGGISASTAGSTTITAVIDGVSGTKSVTVVNPPPPLKVTLYGPGTIRSNSTCYWWTSVSGGTAPYTYYWYGGSSSWRTDSDFNASATGSFYLDVKVTDANGNVAWGSKYVTVSSNAGACPV